MKPFIVLIPIEDSIENPRSACEQIENTTFNNANSALEVLGKVQYELGIESSHNIEVEPITDFMDRVNDEQFNPDNYFMSYVYTSEVVK